MQPVLDGIEGTPYKRVHIVQLNEVVPNKEKEYGKAVQIRGIYRANRQDHLFILPRYAY